MDYDTDVDSLSVESDEFEEEIIEIDDGQVAVQAATTSEDQDSDDSWFDENEGHHTEEPLTDKEWLQEYEKKEEEYKKTEEMLNKRLSGAVPVSEWCKCGLNCTTNVLKNISECYCCKELDGCVEALESDIVLQDFEEDTVLKCITEHPGFSPVCLQKWSLRLSADKYKTRERKSYKQLGSEERFLRSIAYREFTRLVYGWLGKKKRIPLPASAYSSIRSTFPVSDDELYSGFEMDLEPLE